MRSELLFVEYQQTVYHGLHSMSGIRGAVKKFPDFFFFSSSVWCSVRTAWTDRYLSFHRAGFAEVAPCSSEEAARQVAGRGQWFLHHDNSPSHASLVEQQILAEKNIPLIIHSPKDLDLSDVWVIHTL
jgi:hypothetical protein